MKLSLENTQKTQRVKNLWKLDYPPHDPEQRWIWIDQVQDHLFGTREMQDELLKAWGFSYTRKDRRKKPLRDKMGGISLRARDHLKSGKEEGDDHLRPIYRFTRRGCHIAGFGCPESEQRLFSGRRCLTDIDRREIYLGKNKRTISAIDAHIKITAALC